MVERLNPSRSGRRQLLALAVVVSLVHLWATQQWVVDRFGGAAAGRLIRPIEVAFVRELLPTAPPPMVKPMAPPRPAHRRAAVAKPPASAPERPAESMPEPTAERPAEPVPMQADDPVAARDLAQPVEPAPDVKPPEAAAAADAAASDAATHSMPPPSRSVEPGVAAASAPEADAAASSPGTLAVYDEWPPSTQLSYRLNGNYRGEILGHATVEWIRVGLDYQVHLEARVGAPFAPLMTRRISSQGVLTEAGLAPRRFEGQQRIGFQSRRWSIRFEPERIVLADSRVVESAVGAQDEASQFVQLTWLFTTQPTQLQVGRSVEFPLALPRRVDRWIYDVVGEQTLQLPFGPVASMHVKPRRAVRPGDLSAEMWIAPSLQYLPVRILIRQDAETFVDLMLEKPPLQAQQR